MMRLYWIAPAAMLAASAASAWPQTPESAFDRETAVARLPPVLARWTFDEPFGAACRDSGEGGRDASAAGRGALAIGRTEGVLGRALSLSGQHLLELEGDLFSGPMRALTFSAWTLPTDLSEYREIFRKEDGDRRVLFSFQGDGAILSLGINVGGYVECDAPIDPARLLDGSWHHCAATFDGRHLRVFLDGEQAGELERPGTIACGGSARPCIGSMNGGECFQGLLDDLRIYDAALSPLQIAAIREEGLGELAAKARPQPGGEPAAGPALLAHWTFNERAAGAPIRDVSGREPATDVGAGGERGGSSSSSSSSGAILRTSGVHGGAIDLRGSHRLEVSLGDRLEGLGAISFSAWTRPRDLRGFREIFRQECPRRLLFSFQEGGAILSLGLNVGGYAECDAPIDPARLLDGDWHHCAATFDGDRYRVYLDGDEIGSLHRGGALAVDVRAPAFIGSSSGTGEHFQGEIDDLRIHAAALSPEDVALLYQSGREALERAGRAVEAALAGIYRRETDFAETIALARQRLAEGGIELDRDLAEALARRISADFPQECETLREAIGAGPLEYLVAPDDGFAQREARRFAELLVEYRPLTEGQWRRQSADERRKWEEVDRIASRLARLEEQGSPARSSAEWLRVLLDAARRVEHRPVRHEPVAPYIRPETPTTRDLPREEAVEALRRDWLHQADGQPTPERIRNEIRWASELAARICAHREGRVDFARELAELQAVEEEASRLASADPQLYFQVRAIKRR
ncbi:MAG: LamG domain-containing protein, partial [Planctomycetes bacterium]|nr:LamG domain-containing protein [Planctomycetota bacterium]